MEVAENGTTAQTVRKMDREKTEIERIKESIHYKVAGLIIGIKRSPLKNFLLLPLRVFQLYREHKREKQMEKARPATLLAHGFDRSYRNRVKYVNVTRELHRAPMFLPAPSFKNSPKLDIRVGALLDAEMLSCIEPDAHVSVVPEKDWESYLEETRPQFIIVNAAWKLFQGGGLAFADNTHWAVRFLTHCRTLGVPTLFWYTDCVDNTNAFRTIFENVDHIFCCDEIAQDKISRNFASKIREILPPAIQPALHNGFHFSLLERGRLDYLYDGWADMLEYPEDLSALLQGLKDKGLHIIDSRNTMIANRLADLPQWRGQIFGSVHYKRLISAMKCYSVCLFPRRTLVNEVTRSKRILEALACGAGVVAAAESCRVLPEDVLNSAGELLVISDENGFSEAAQKLKAKKRDPDSHRLKRYLQLHHTYADRLLVMCRYAGLVSEEVGESRHPKVSVITPTKRPDLLVSRLDNYIDQSYRNREWIILVNGNNTDVDLLQKTIEPHHDIRIEMVHQQGNLGACLNSGMQMATGKLWFKMDDDDFYGSNYLLDMVLAWRTTGADTFGKPPAFVYIEEEDALFCRGNVSYASTVVSGPNPQFCGATIAGTVPEGQKHIFSQAMRSAIDTIFFEDAHTSGQLLVFTDPYNFTVYRASAAHFHTWRPDISKMIEHSEMICAGRGQEEVNI